MSPDERSVLDDLQWSLHTSKAKVLLRGLRLIKFCDDHKVDTLVARSKSGKEMEIGVQ